MVVNARRPRLEKTSQAAGTTLPKPIARSRRLSILPPLGFQILVLGGQQQIQHPLVPVQKIFGDLVVFGVGVVDSGDAAFRDEKSGRIKTA